MHYLAYHEGKRHTTADFPAAYYYVDKDYYQYNMPFHWHTEWEIIRILQGELALFADEAELCAEAGDVLLIRDGMLHGGVPRDCVYECLVFDLRGLFRDINPVKKYLRPIYHNQLLPHVLYPGRQKDIYPIVEELMKAFSAFRRKDSRYNGQLPEADGAQALLALGNLSRLFAVILQKQYYDRCTGEAWSDSRKVTQVKPVLEYIEAHYSGPLTLEDLSHVAGMSPKYFCRFFHSITQQTPMDYVNYYRIEQAASLLCSTDMTVTAIGMECGFNDSSYFVKAFKRYKGMTPRQYQKANS